jgi:hypothetical protein
VGVFVFFYAPFLQDILAGSRTGTKRCGFVTCFGKRPHRQSTETDVFAAATNHGPQNPGSRARFLNE